jgi:hypothetical protein
MEKNMHKVSTIAPSTIMVKIFQKMVKACHAIVFMYPLDVVIMHHIFSVIAFKILSEFEF